MLYTYKCTSKYCDKSNAKFEVTQKLSAPKLVTCGVCGEDTLTKVITNCGGFTLKGRGWGGKRRVY